uniref:Uncharacterized protein n=1 Tax=Panagrolaimus davidi TaxID=227884 RepID=A0A914QXK9_9BILA
MTSMHYSRIQSNFSKIQNGNSYLPTTTFLNRTNRTTATNNKTVQFILSNARYFFLPIASLFDFLHSLAGISEENYKNQKYFVFSLHCTVWLQLSIFITAFSTFAMFNPILRELVNLQFELSQQWQRDCGIFELLLNLPTYGYIQKFMFFQFFCFFHTILVIIGFKTQLPIYFAPSQMALVRLLFCYHYISL